MPDSKGEVSGDVIARAAASDEAALRAIFDTYADRVYRLAFRMTADRHLAEDVTQDTFVRAFARLHQFRGNARFGTWLHGVAASVALNALRSRRRSGRELPLDVVVERGTAERRVEPDVRDRLLAALQGLPPEQRIVLLMFDVEGYSHEEIARSLAIGTGASRMRLARARQLMREALERDREELEHG